MAVSDGPVSSHAVVEEAADIAAAAVEVEAAAVDVVDGEEDDVGAGDEEELARVGRRMSVRWPSYQILVGRGQLTFCSKSAPLTGRVSISSCMPCHLLHAVCMIPQWVPMALSPRFMIVLLK
jgi:hypothetical protein